MGQQLKDQWNGDASPQHSEQQDIHVLLAVLPVAGSLMGVRSAQEGAVEAEFAWTLV